MSEIQIERVKNKVNPLILKRKEILTELVAYIESISNLEQSNVFIGVLIKKSKKRYKKDINLLAKGKIYNIGGE